MTREKTQELAKVRQAIDDALSHPSDLNVGEFDKLQRRCNLLQQQIEVEKNIYSGRISAAKRDAMSRVITIPSKMNV